MENKKDEAWANSKHPADFTVGDCMSGTEIRAFCEAGFSFQEYTREEFAEKWNADFASAMGRKAVYNKHIDAVIMIDSQK